MSGRAAAVPLLIALLVGCNVDSSPALQDPTTGTEDTGSELVPAQQAIQQAEIAGSDLGTMNGAEVSKVVDPGPHCSFSYVSEGKPVLVAALRPRAGAAGYVKLHGKLVELTAPVPDLRALASGAMFRTDGMAVAVQPLESADAVIGRQGEADLVFQTEQGLRVGYGGFYRCASDGLPQAH